MNNCRLFNLHSEIVTRVEKVGIIKKKKLSSVKLSFHLPIIDNGVWPFSPEQRYISIHSPFCSLPHFFLTILFNYIFSRCAIQLFLSLPAIKTKKKRKKGKKKRYIPIPKASIRCLYDIYIYIHRKRFPRFVNK